MMARIDRNPRQMIDALSRAGAQVRKSNPTKTSKPFTQRSFQPVVPGQTGPKRRRAYRSRSMREGY